jgi:hypothetical protein
MLVYGPRTIREWAINHSKIDTLDTDAYGDVLIDLDRKRLLYWYFIPTYEPLYFPHMNALFAQEWSGWSITFARRGRAELGEYAGIPVRDRTGLVYPDDTDINSLMVATSAEAALYMQSIYGHENENISQVIKGFVDDLVEQAKREKSMRLTIKLSDALSHIKQNDFLCIDALELQILLDSTSPKQVIFLDVRSGDPLTNNQYRPVVSIPFLALPRRFGGLPGDETLTVVCIGESDTLADAAARCLLDNRNFRMVFSLHEDR